METIQITISSRLARRLRPYQQDLTRVLEWGLRYAEEKLDATSSEATTAEALAAQKKTVAALRQAGAVGPEPEVTAEYLAQLGNRTWRPIIADGKPASEIIIEERGSYRTAEQ
jgi:hypothetical protein